MWLSFDRIQAVSQLVIPNFKSSFKMALRIEIRFLLFPFPLLHALKLSGWVSQFIKTSIEKSPSGFKRFLGKVVIIVP